MSFDILNLKDYGPKNDRGYKYVLVINDKLSKFGWTVLLNKSGQLITDSFGNILNSSKRRPNLLESDDWAEFVYKIFTDLLNKNNIRRFSRKTSLGAIFAERFNCTKRDLL